MSVVEPIERVGDYTVCRYRDSAWGGTKFFLRNARGYGLDGEYRSQEKATEVARALTAAKGEAPR